jgi:hypothetical protein
MWFVLIWNQPHDLSYPSRVGLSRSEINHTTYRTQVELVWPYLRSTRRPIIPKSSWFVPIWDQPDDLLCPSRGGLALSEINHTTDRTQVELVLSRYEINQTTYRTQVELVCPDLWSTIRPIVPKYSWFGPIWDQPDDRSYPSRAGFVPIWDQPHDLSCPSRVGLSWSEINLTTYRTQGELVCPDLRSTTRPIVPKSSWFVPIWDQPHDLSCPSRVGLSWSEINHTTYRIQDELACPDLKSSTRPIVPKSSWFIPIWDQPHELSYPRRVGLSRSENNHTTDRTQVELVLSRSEINQTTYRTQVELVLSQSEINQTTYHTQVELVCPDLRSTTRPIVPKSSWFVPIWDQPHDLPYPSRVGLSRSEINNATYRTQVELVWPYLRSTIRPIVPK